MHKGLHSVHSEKVQHKNKSMGPITCYLCDIKFPNVAPSTDCVWTSYDDKMGLKEVVVGKSSLCKTREKREKKKPTYVIHSYSYLYLHDELVMCTR